MTTTEPTIAEALREIAGQCDLVWEVEIWGDKVWGMRGFTDFKQGTEKQNQWGIFGAICQECNHREWDWEAGRIRDSDNKIVFEFSIQNQYNYAVIASDYSFDSPAHAAVLAFLKAIKGPAASSLAGRAS